MFGWNDTKQSDESICVEKTYRKERQMNFLNTTGLIKYINPLNAIIYFIIINLIGFILMYIDKKRAKYGRWRIPEKTLIIVRNIRWFYWLYDRNVYI